MENWEQTELGFLADTPRKFWSHSVQTTGRNKTEFQVCSESFLSLESVLGDLQENVLQVSLGMAKSLGQISAQGGLL